MIRTFRGPVVALVALLLVSLSIPANAHAGIAQAGRALARPDKNLPRFSTGEARALLKQAKGQLRVDEKRLRSNKPVGDAPETDITMTLRDLALARTSLSGSERREADAVLARPSDLGGDYLGWDIGRVAYPAVRDWTPRRSQCEPGQKVCIHWVGKDPDRNRRRDSYEAIGSESDGNRNGIPDFVESVDRTLSEVWAHEIGRLGYQAPLDDDGYGGDTNNPDERVDIYLAELGDRGLYGYCVPEGAGGQRQQTGYCVLDNDYAQNEYGARPIDSLRATAAHEFFHAIQFGYDVGEDLWFMEGTATWVEDEVYDSINDNYQFLTTSPIRYPRTALDYPGYTFPYGSFIFFTYTSERLGAGTVREYWNRAVGQTTSLQAIYAVVGAAQWRSFFATFGSWNTLPLRSYSERAGYPPAAWWLKKTLSNQSSTTGWRSVRISHPGNAPMLVAPDRRLSPGKRLLVQVNGPSSSLGTAALLQRRYRDGRVTHTMIKLDQAGNGRTLVQFDRRVLRSVAVISSNTNRYGGTRAFKVRASLR